MSFDLADFGYSRQRAAVRAAAQRRHFTIGVGGQTIGLPVDCVKTIFHIERLTPVPLAAREIAGLANLRGRIVTAVHLDRCLGMGGSADAAPSRLAVGVEHNGEDYALLVDETGDVVISEEADRIAAPAHLDARLLELLAACYRSGDEFLSVLDVDALVRRLSKQSELSFRGGMTKNHKKGAKQ
jgi:purine-binding chemotaxis protein CheW